MIHDLRHIFVRGDIGDGRLLARLFDEQRPRAVVHLAAESHVDRSIEAPAAFVETNVVGTFRLLEAAHDYWTRLTEPERTAFRLLHVSTDEVYGSLGSTGRFSEASPYAPNSPYAASKAAADHFARAFGRTYGLPVLVTHSSNNYGPFQHPEKLIPRMILNCVAGQPLPVYGDGLQVRDWLHVDDHCRALRRVLACGVPGRTYDIGGESERTNLEAVRRIAQCVDRLRPGLPHAPCASLLRFVADRPGHDWRYALDSTRIRGELDWRPRETFESGLERTVGWYLDHAGWVGRFRTDTQPGRRI